MTRPDLISPAMAIAHMLPEFVASLTPKERIVFANMARVWLRPAQLVPDRPFRTLSFSGARGWGKTHAIGKHLNEGVAHGLYRAPALLGPNDERVDEVMVQTLIDTAVPWCRPKKHKGQLLWPNGVFAELFTAEAEGRSRGGNYDVSWMSEIVDWQATTRDEAFNNLFTATRQGCERVFCDTTSRGQNSVILKLRKLHEDDPRMHIRVEGTTFDNPLLTRTYLRSVCANYTLGSRRFLEEIMGMIFAESAGALWEQDWINSNRRPMAPERPRLTLLAADPAITAREGSDETGLVVGSLGQDEHVYITADLSGKLAGGAWVKLVVDRCALDAAGLVVETSRGGSAWTELLRAHAGPRGFEVSVLEKGKPFPTRLPGTIYVREVHAVNSKHSRGEGPADLGRAGYVHHVGDPGQFKTLEDQLVTWEPGSGPSPDRLDAHAYLISELRGLARPKPVDNTTQLAGAAEINRRLMNFAAARSRGVGL